MLYKYTSTALVFGNKFSRLSKHARGAKIVIESVSICVDLRILITPVGTFLFAEIKLADANLATMIVENLAAKRIIDQSIIMWNEDKHSRFRMCLTQGPSQIYL